MSIRRARALAVIALAGVAASVVVLLVPSSSAYTARVEFANASGLLPGSQVRIAGAAVGSVQSLTVTPGTHAIATLRIDRAAAPIGRAAQAFVRDATLFSEKYVDLQPGDVHDPARSGSYIPLSRSGGPVELDDLLNTFDSDTQHRLAILLNELGTSLTGRGIDVNWLLTNLPPSLSQTRALVSQLASDNHALGHVVVLGDRLVGAIVPQRAALGRLIAGAEGALGAFAGRRRELTSAIREGAPTLAQLRQSLRQLSALSRPLAPAADALRSLSPALDSTLRRLPTFAGAARSPLRQVTAMAPRLRQLGVELAPVLERFGPTGRQAVSTARALAPVSRLLVNATPDALAFAQSFWRATQHRDSVGWLIRADSGVTQESLLGAIAGPNDPLGALANGFPPVYGGPNAAPIAPQNAPRVATPNRPAPLSLPPLPPIDPLRSVQKHVQELHDHLTQLLGVGAPASGASPPRAPADGQKSLGPLLRYLLGR